MSRVRIEVEGYTAAGGHHGSEPDMGHMVIAYRTIADELRKTADEVEACP